MPAPVSSREEVLGRLLATFRRDGFDGASLAELSPVLLPSVPIDRITGGPLHYRVVNGKPVVYSVGVDRDDDGGVAPKDPIGQPDPLQAAEWHVAPGKVVDGDWVLFPPLSVTDQDVSAVPKLAR